MTRDKIVSTRINERLFAECRKRNNLKMKRVSVRRTVIRKIVFSERVESNNWCCELKKKNLIRLRSVVKRWVII